MSETLHVVCPHCHTTNRVRQDDLGKTPDCGSCHQTLFSGHPAQLDEAAFERHVAHSQIPVLVDFWAPWCGPCRVVGPVLEEIAAERDDLRVVKLNIDDNQQTTAQFDVLSIPTMILFRNGAPVKKVIGAYPKKKIEAQLFE